MCPQHFPLLWQNPPQLAWPFPCQTPLTPTALTYPQGSPGASATPCQPDSPRPTAPHKSCSPSSRAVLHQSSSSLPPLGRAQPRPRGGRGRKEPRGWPSQQMVRGSTATGQMPWHAGADLQAGREPRRCDIPRSPRSASCVASCGLCRSGSNSCRCSSALLQCCASERERKGMEGRVGAESPLHPELPFPARTPRGLRQQPNKTRFGGSRGLGVTWGVMVPTCCQSPIGPGLCWYSWAQGRREVWRKSPHA